MAGVIPGQKTDDLAWASMELTPLWAADRMVSRRQGGMTILSLYMMMPSMVERWARN